MEVSENPPSLWDSLVTEPCQTKGFADAMRSLGYRPFYLTHGDSGALALVRGMLFGVSRLTARANLFVPAANPPLVLEALRSLADLGIPHVKVGDHMWGLKSNGEDNHWEFPGTRVIQRHTFVLDLGHSEDLLVKKQESSVRSSWRKAEREGVKVREVATEEDIITYIRLATETSARVRAVTAYTEFPAAFFKQLYLNLYFTGAGKFYMAFINDVPLAGGIFLCSKDRMVYFSGASQRDRKWTPLQAPTAVLWHAIRGAKRLGLARFDFGGCTPTDDANDPRHSVYMFKKRWGGELEIFYNLDVVLSPLSSYLQERVLSPLWDRVHPLYFRLIQQRKES